MLVLALDTTARAGSLALVADDRVLAERIGDPARSHAERLPGDLVELLRACDTDIGAIDVFAVASGPGSFTGLRVGIATIQGLAFATRRQVVPVSALEALAHLAAEGRPRGALVGVWTDAFRKEVFSALYRLEAGTAFSDDRLQEIEAASAGDPAATLGRWTAIGTPAAVVGDGATMYAGLLNTTILPTPPIAGAIGRIAARRAAAGLGVNPAGVHPLYVRRPDAEVERDRRNTKDTEDTKKLEDTKKIEGAAG